MQAHDALTEVQSDQIEMIRFDLQHRVEVVGASCAFYTQVLLQAQRGAERCWRQLQIQTRRVGCRWRRAGLRCGGAGAQQQSCDRSKPVRSSWQTQAHMLSSAVRRRLLSRTKGLLWSQA